MSVTEIVITTQIAGFLPTTKPCLTVFNYHACIVIITLIGLCCMQETQPMWFHELAGEDSPPSGHVLTVAQPEEGDGGQTED